MNEVTLTVPAKSDFLHLLRTVVSSVAARQEFSVDSIDDLRLSVDEAGAYLLALHGDHLKLRVEASDASLAATIGTDAEVRRWPSEGSEQRISWKILCGLTDEASFVREDWGPGIRLVKQRDSFKV